MKKKLTKEAIIGIVTIVSIGLLYFGINYLKGVNLFKPVNHYYVEFKKIKDLTVSSPVYVEGFKIGLVRSVHYDYKTTDKIIVEISLEDAMRINRGSYIVLENSFLSGASLHIYLNKYVDEFVKSGDALEGRLDEDMILCTGKDSAGCRNHPSQDRFNIDGIAEYRKSSGAYTVVNAYRTNHGQLGSIN
jgi:phospholipid/cholesterol/gamma-HCH transport system substrate-binding protein